MDPIDLSPSYLGYVYLKSNKPTVASILFIQIDKSMVDAIELGNEYYVTKLELGRMCAIQGKKEEAMMWLEQAFEDGWFDYRLAILDPCFDLIREEKAFVKLLGEMKKRVYLMRKNIFDDNTL
jgi:hypothetical protein